MKIPVIKSIFIIMLLGMGLTVLAKSVIVEFKVHGQCGECKERIEKVLDKPGISYATWDVKTKMLKVRYNDKKYSEDDLHALINSIGYHTEKSNASKEQVNQLPKCCQPGGH